jgi:hypothetical protein
VKRLAAALAVLASLSAVAVAQGEVVQTFSYRITDVKPWGGYTVIFSSSSYDLQGAIPAELNEYFQRLPKGAKVPRVLRSKRYYCDAQVLVNRIRATKGSTRFTPFLDRLLRGRKTQPKSSRDLYEVCRYAQIGTGRVTVDARPFEERPIPADLRMFWTKPARGAVAAFAIVGIPDERAPVVRENTTVRETVPTLVANFYDEPTADGLYGYKLVLPAGPINGIRVSVERVDVTVTGLTHVKRTRRCTRKRRGRCVKRKTTVTRTFWFTQPACPPSGNLSFQAFFGYKDPAVADQLKTYPLACPPDFRR